MAFSEYADNEIRNELRETLQTKVRGTYPQEYQLYLDLADDGSGGDITNNGKPLKTFDEWINS